MKRLFTLIIILFSFSTIAQTYSITQEIYDDLGEIKYFGIKEVEVEYYPMIDSLIYSDTYNYYLMKMETFREGYEKYVDLKQKDSIVFSKKLRIKELIDEYFLNRKNKKLLDEAHELAEEFNIKVVITDELLGGTRELKIKNNSGRYISRSNLLLFKREAEKLINSHSYSYGSNHNYTQYKHWESELNKISDKDKYTKNKIISKNSKKKITKIATSDTENSIIGEYKIVNKDYYVNSRGHSDYEVNELFKECITKDCYSYRGSKVLILEEVSTKEQIILDKETLIAINRASSRVDNIRKLEAKGFKVIVTKVNSDYEEDRYDVDVGNSLVEASVLIKNLDQDSDYINKVNKFWNEYENIQNKMLSYELQLSNYYNNWRVQGRNTPTSTINAWREVTRKSIIELQKSSKLVEENHYLYVGSKSKKNLSDISKIDNMLTLIGNSRYVLGI